MGTDKKGGGLDDLKARLGLDSVLSKPQAPEPKPAEAEAPSGPGGAPPPPSTPGAQAPTVDKMPSGDYAIAVSTFEEPVAGEGEPDPVLTDSHKLVDLNLAVPVSKGARIAMVVTIVVLLIVMLAAGFGFGKVMRDREVANQVIVSAGDMLGQVEPVSERLGEFQSLLNAQGEDYTPELHAVFVDFFEGSGPVLGSRTITDGRIIMTTGEDLARDLLNFSVGTQMLQAIVQEHLRKTAREMTLIRNLMAEDQAEVNYAVYFDYNQIARDFQEFVSDPEVTEYTPGQGWVVTYENLEMTVEGEVPEDEDDEDMRSFHYSVMAGGTRQQIPVFNLVTIRADQLVTNPNEETALTRYRGRVRSIKAQLEGLLRSRDVLIQQLEERAGGSTSFVL